MLILLPPSEGKTAPPRGAPANPAKLSFPELTDTRQSILSALVRLCRDDPGSAATVLGLGPTQADEVVRNAGLIDAPAAPARNVYTGVLYDALGLRTLEGAAARRATRSIAITSGLWGLLRPTDRIPAYRLGGGVSLPGVGSLAAHWQTTLGDVVPAIAGRRGAIIDLRSTTYEAFWRPDAALAPRTAKVRVLHEQNGTRSVVSHHSKATKGHVVRDLLCSAAAPGTPAELADVLNELGWKAELREPERAARPWGIDVVVTHVPTR
ncbi:peroxide stress protein YaaA [Phytoactinopolyspora halotolerans]|uniref:Peroxide stress protein YaaA n=1 Tax=Phytoactinopolyspora halotolerans TaxID=1981512 RepID=A0A6L9SA44_9ACTN|nr:peroxide stress protein YaaA [Phytoactinopolyspora halotolerans]NEE01969.1 peroxide stress protein YaaA [Phytoactinopolyspora halotolerans]